MSSKSEPKRQKSNTVLSRKVWVFWKVSFETLPCTNEGKFISRWLCIKPCSQHYTQTITQPSAQLLSYFVFLSINLRLRFLLVTFCIYWIHSSFASFFSACSGLSSKTSRASTVTQTGVLQCIFVINIQDTIYNWVIVFCLFLVKF